MPDALQSELKAKMEAAGIPVPDSEERWGKALEALKVRNNFFSFPLVSVFLPLSQSPIPQLIKTNTSSARATHEYQADHARLPAV